MPYKTIVEERGVLTQWWGHAMASEMIEMQERAHAIPDFDTLRYSIHDFSECGQYDSDQNEIEYSAAIDGAASKSNPQIKIAIVGANKQVVEVITAYMKAGLSPYPLRFFSSMDEARAWVA